MQVVGRCAGGAVEVIRRWLVPELLLPLAAEGVAVMPWTLPTGGSR